MDYFNEQERAKQQAFSARRDSVFGPVVRALTRLGITANVVTVAGVLVLIGGVVAAHWTPWVYVPAVILYVILDGIDGPLARATGTTGAIGALSDVTADQIGVPIVLAFAAYEGVLGGAPAALLSGLYIISIYNILTCNTLKAPQLFTLRLKYPIFALVAAFLLFDLPRPWFDALAWAISAYYLAMIFLNLRRAGRP